MASASGNASPDLISQEQKLLKNASRYSFIMLHRSLSALANRQGGIVRVRPSLTMSLPRSEVA